MHFFPPIAFWNVSIVEFQEAMEGEVFLSGSQVDNIGDRKVIKGIELVSLAEVYHVIDQSLLVGDLSVELEMVEAKAIFPYLMVFEAERVLCPFKVKELSVGGLSKRFPQGENPFNYLMVVALTQIIVPRAFNILIYWLHSLKACEGEVC